MTQSARGRDGHSFGTFKGVFTPSILTILGVVMYLRTRGWRITLPNGTRIEIRVVES